MSPIATRLPFTPADIGKPGVAMISPGAKALARAAFVLAKGVGSPSKSSETLAEKLYPGDSITRSLVTRGAVSPANTSSFGGIFSTDVVADFIVGLAPISAAASLMQVAPYVPLGDAGRILFPRRATAPSGDPCWVEEGKPAAVKSYTLSTVPLGPVRKLAVITHTTREAAESSGAETAIETLLREETALQLNQSLFSDVAAADDARPAGILNGIAALTPSAAPALADALDEDLAALAAAIAPVASGLAIVAHPSQINAIKLRRGAPWPIDVPLWPTIGVVPGIVIALDPQSFVSGFDSVPVVQASRETLIHEDCRSSRGSALI